MRKQQRQFTKRRGAVMVEMALVLPIFFTVVLGIIEFGRAMMVGNLVTNATREGARLAILDGTTNTEVTDAVKTFLASAATLNANDVTVTITTQAAAGNPDPGGNVANCKPRDLITVQVQVPFNKVAYVPGKYLAGKNLKGSSSMRHE